MGSIFSCCRQSNKYKFTDMTKYVSVSGKTGIDKDYHDMIGLVWDIFDNDMSGAIEKNECKEIVKFILEKVLD